MKNANQILTEKGYDNSEQNDIINFKTKYSENGLDIQVRGEFGLQDEPLHLWAEYAVGDADEDVLERVANEKGYEDVHSLLNAMTIRLNALCEELPTAWTGFSSKELSEKIYGQRPDFTLDTENGKIYFHKVEGGYIEDPEHGDTVFTSLTEDELREQYEEQEN